jgi:hypothetical protein
VDRFVQGELYETLVVAAVSQFEAFIGDVISAILKAYPKKLAVVPGVGKDKDQCSKEVSLEVILRSGSYAEIIDSIIAARCEMLFFAPPKKYIEYLGEIAGIDTSDEAFSNYIEIKASRDIIIHNNKIANTIYQSKAGKDARAQVGENIVVDAKYFDHTVMILKRISGIIARDTRKTFGRKDDEAAN